MQMQSVSDNNNSVHASFDPTNVSESERFKGFFRKLNEFEELAFSISESCEEFLKYFEKDGLKFYSFTCWYYAPEHFTMLQQRLDYIMDPFFEMNMNEAQIQNHWKTYSAFEGVIIIVQYCSIDKEKCIRDAQTVSSKLKDFLSTVNLSKHEEHIKLINCFRDKSKWIECDC